MSLMIINFLPCSFDYIHKKQTGGSGQFGRVIGKIQVGNQGWVGTQDGWHTHLGTQDVI